MRCKKVALLGTRCTLPNLTKHRAGAGPRHVADRCTPFHNKSTRRISTTSKHLEMDVVCPWWLLWDGWCSAVDLDEKQRFLERFFMLLAWREREIEKERERHKTISLRSKTYRWCLQRNLLRSQCILYLEPLRRSSCTPPGDIPLGTRRI